MSDAVIDVPNYETIGSSSIIIMFVKIIGKMSEVRSEENRIHHHNEMMCLLCSYLLAF